MEQRICWQDRIYADYRVVYLDWTYRRARRFANLFVSGPDWVDAVSDKPDAYEVTLFEPVDFSSRSSVSGIPVPTENVRWLPLTAPQQSRGTMQLTEHQCHTAEV